MTAWKRSGLRLLLSQRRWEVHLVVADGLWLSRSVPEFVRDVSLMDIRARQLGPFESPLPDGDLDAFIGEMRGHMEVSLREMQKGTA
jgi:hypothetical protein